MYQWQCHPEAEQLVMAALEQCRERNPFIAELDHALLNETSTRLFDWLDHVVIDRSATAEQQLKKSGFVTENDTGSYRVWHHPGAQLPRVVEAKHSPGIAVTVESIDNFLMVHGLSRVIEGSPLSLYRRCLVSAMPEANCWIVERRGTNAMDPTDTTDTAIANYLAATEVWKTRSRGEKEPSEEIAEAFQVAEKIIALVGQDLAAWIVLHCEREYWQARNTAGQLQKNRQDRLGMGWANHDHHTFRSSRRYFHQLVRLFELLGFYCRERFYAGDEAGWGAQVMEHRNARLVLFLDVDLLPHERDLDFRNEPLPELKKHATVGLWCALHGDSILKSGMHHLEAQFMFDQLKNDLAKSGIKMMEPFSAFPFLHQAFTQGERWKVPPQHLEQLVRNGEITAEQSQKFLAEGAIGSHLENLQRREGYKGFNQRNVSTIIQRTDPRNINF